MILIEDLQTYLRENKIFISSHAAERLRQRKITTTDITTVIETGEIIEQYPDDKPFPSCLIMGKNASGEILHLVSADNGAAALIITGYQPDRDRWCDDFKTRKGGTF